MISRLTAIAATFAILATASLAYAANVQQARTEVTGKVRTVQLERVTVTARRAPQAPL